MNLEEAAAEPLPALSDAEQYRTSSLELSDLAESIRVRQEQIHKVLESEGQDGESTFSKLFGMYLERRNLIFGQVSLAESGKEAHQFINERQMQKQDEVSPVAQISELGHAMKKTMRQSLARRLSGEMYKTSEQSESYHQSVIDRRHEQRDRKDARNVDEEEPVWQPSHYHQSQHQAYGNGRKHSQRQRHFAVDDIEDSEEDEDKVGKTLRDALQNVHRSGGHTSCKGCKFCDVVDKHMAKCKQDQEALDRKDVELAQERRSSLSSYRALGGPPWTQKIERRRSFDGSIINCDIARAQSVASIDYLANDRHAIRVEPSTKRHSVHSPQGLHEFDSSTSHHPRLTPESHRTRPRTSSSIGTSSTRRRENYSTIPGTSNVTPAASSRRDRESHAYKKTSSKNSNDNHSSSSSSKSNRSSSRNGSSSSSTAAAAATTTTTTTTTNNNNNNNNNNNDNNNNSNSKNSSKSNNHDTFLPSKHEKASRRKSLPDQKSSSIYRAGRHRPGEMYHVDDDPLMVECVECHRWVKASTHENNLAIGYCCSNVLISRIDVTPRAR